MFGIPTAGLLCAGLTGLGLTMGFAPFSQPLAGWLALIPLAYYGVRERPDLRQSFGLGWFAGATHFLTTFSWLTSVTVAGWFVLCLYMAIYPALWFVLWVRFAGRDGEPMTSAGNIRHAVLGASAWVLTEWLRGIVFSGFGWNELGVSQGNLLLLAQIADLGGVPLLSWVVAFGGLTLTLTVRRFELEIRGAQKWKPRWDFTAGVFVLGMTMVYGARTVLHPTEKGVSTLSYAAIQPAVPQDPWRSAGITKVAEELTRGSEIALAQSGPVDLLVWPESLSGTGWREEPEFQRAIQNARHMGARSLLTGSLDIRGPETFNSAILFTGPEGRSPQVYDKNHLVIMGEYVPLAGVFPWLRKLVPPGGDLTAGKNIGILELDGSGVKIAPLICFEDSVPEVVRRAAGQLPHLLVNLTNDAWFGKSAGAKQHLENARFRAIETRLPLLRATNDGVTALISPKGVILDRELKSYQRAGFIAGEISFSEPKFTLYTQWGDWIVGLSTGFVLLGLIWTRSMRGGA
ncbi:MAG: apolipoprotein N-acyltransferase [Proteobacteria bacterium]|nr:apolipoprotein N-acyltransferase [Pseudomonadota bacterium]